MDLILYLGIWDIMAVIKLSRNFEYIKIINDNEVKVGAATKPY